MLVRVGGVDLVWVVVVVEEVGDECFEVVRGRRGWFGAELCVWWRNQRTCLQQHVRNRVDELARPPLVALGSFSRRWQHSVVVGGVGGDVSVSVAMVESSGVGER